MSPRRLAFLLVFLTGAAAAEPAYAQSLIAVTGSVTDRDFPNQPVDPLLVIRVFESRTSDLLRSIRVDIKSDGTFRSEFPNAFRGARFVLQPVAADYFLFDPPDKIEFFPNPGGYDFALIVMRKASAAQSKMNDALEAVRRNDLDAAFTRLKEAFEFLKVYGAGSDDPDVARLIEESFGFLSDLMGRRVAGGLGATPEMVQFAEDVTHDWIFSRLSRADESKYLRDTVLSLTSIARKSSDFADSASPAIQRIYDLGRSIDPDDYTLVQTYYLFLASQQQYADAAQAIQDYLSSHTGTAVSKRASERVFIPFFLDWIDLLSREFAPRLILVSGSNWQMEPELQNLCESLKAFEQPITRSRLRRANDVRSVLATCEREGL